MTSSALLQVLLESRLQPVKKLEVILAHRLSRQANIFQHGQVGKDIGDLEGAPNAQVGHAVERQVGDIRPLKEHLSAGGRRTPAEQIEEGGFSGAVGADDGMQAEFLDLDTDIVHGHQSAKFFAKILRFQKNFCSDSHLVILD